MAKRRPRMTREQLARLPRLLWMRYKPSEIAAEIGLSVDTIYKNYIPAGCPHERDNDGKYWIVGTEFAQWAKRAAGKQKLAENQGWCMTCKQPVDLIGPEIVRPSNRRVDMVTCTCAICGGKVIKTRAKNDQS